MIVNLTKKTAFFLVWLFALLPISMSGKMAARQSGDTCPMVKIVPERMPDLNIPRFGHSILNLNGEITVIGGHTTGFIPTPTIEYFRDGKWNLINMTYIHDHGSAVPLKSGKVLIAGSYEKNIGIGQTFETEIYDPTTHTITGFSWLDRKRANAFGMELDSGKIVITGNWYHDDGIELFDGTDHFIYIKDVARQRTCPHIFRTAPDNAIILGRKDPWGMMSDSIVIDRLKGEPFTVPFFDEWKPLSHEAKFGYQEAFIGNEEKGDYTYLTIVENAQMQAAIAKVENGSFSLLPTTHPVPMTCDGRNIYYNIIIADQQSKRAYMIGDTHYPNVTDTTTDKRLSDEACHYILRIDYGKAEEEGTAPVTLYHTDPIPEIGSSMAVLTDGGDLMLVGGKPIVTASANFTPSASVFLLRFNNQPTTAKSSYSWLWGLLALILAIAVATTLRQLRRRKRHGQENDTKEPQPTSPTSGDNEELMERIRHTIEDKKMYLDSDLTLSSLAEELGMHRNYISACINSQQGCSFTQFVNRYRIAHAKQLMRQHPDTKLNHVAIKSGFSNETSFFRSFKAITGITPTEWKANR